MNQKRKLLSLITALTITTSAFTGFATPVNAAPDFSTFGDEVENVTYYSDDYDAQSVAQIIASVGNEVNAAPDPVELEGITGKITCSAGRRNNGGIGSPTPNIAVTADGKSGNGLTVTSSGYSTSSRGVKFAFDGVPNFADIADGCVLVWEFDTIMSAGSCMEVAGMKLGTDVQGISSTNWVHVQMVFDNAAAKQYVIVTDDDGKLVGSTTATLSGTSIGDVTFYIGTNTVKFDNMTVAQKADIYYEATLTVKDSTPVAVSDVDVKIDNAEYKTDANGQVVVTVSNGTYAYTAQRAGYEATSGMKDPATGTVEVNGANVEQAITLNQYVYTPIPETVTLTGGQAVMTAPHSLETTTSTPYAITVMDQNEVEITDAEITWTILPTGSETADEKVTITDGVVSVAKGFNAGETHIKDFTVTATVAKNGESKSVTTKIKISDYLFYEPGVGGSSYGTTNTAYLNTKGVNEGTECYIATPASKGTTEKIALPDPITFKAGTAQLVSFKTAVQNQTGFTFKRTVSLVDSADTAIVELGYINLDIGNATDATWSSTNSTFATVWGAMPALNSWVDVSVLFKTNANSETKVTLTVAGNEYDLGVTSATGLASINLFLDLNTVNRYALLKDIIVSEVDVTGMEVAGPTEFSTIEGQTMTKEYAVDAMVIEEGETFEWSTTIAGATITANPENSQKATLSVPGTTTNGGTVTIVSSVSTEGKPKTATLDVSIEPAEIVSANVDGSVTLDKTEGTAAYTVSNVLDQFGEDVTEYFTPSWSVEAASGTGAVASFTVNAEEAGMAVAIKASYDNNIVKVVELEEVTLVQGENNINITAPAGAKVMLWDSLRGMKPLANPVIAKGVGASNATINEETGILTVTGVGEVNVVVTFSHGIKQYPFELGVKIDTFSVLADATENSTAVDISSLLEADNIVAYQVTTAKDGKLVKSETVDKATVVDNTITVDTTGAENVEIAPIFEGVTNKVYNIPAGRYNVTVSATNGARTDVYVNEQMMINNMNQGSDNWSVGRTITAEDYLVEDIIIKGGSAIFKQYDDKSGGTSVSKVRFVKAPSIVERAKRIYVIGDSLVANYYGTAPAGQETLVRTGWGQVLQNYIADGVKVTNLGNSGAWAEGMLNDAFTNVRESGQEGDILVLESGYNDSSHTSMEVMKDSVKAMVRGAEAKGMTVFVVTPNASSHSANEYLGSVKSTSDMIVAVTELHEEGSNAILIDLAAKSGFFFKSYYGDATYSGDTASVPEEVVTLLKTYYNNTSDSLHSSYNAANCWAAVIANGILANEATASLVDTTYSYTFNDGINDITVSAQQISNPDYVEYEIAYDAEMVSVKRPNGTVITKATEGDTVKVVPVNGTDTVTVADADVTYNEKTNAYYFIMPAANVTITTVATADNNISEGTE